MDTEVQHDVDAQDVHGCMVHAMQCLVVGRFRKLDTFSVCFDSHGSAPTFVGKPNTCVVSSTFITRLSQRTPTVSCRSHSLTSR